MDSEEADAGDPRAEIARLEQDIEDLTARLESCRKFILAARVAMMAGGVVFLAVWFGLVRFDVRALALAGSALLVGIAVWGSNKRTADETAAELKAAEARRAVLIGMIDLRVVPERRTLQ